jgi:glucans biosynthesis protein C
MSASTRRYDIDWIRVIAIGLLLLYHTAIGFQAWGIMIGFIVNERTWESLWIPMAMLNVWRIPLLFFVSGMGVYFAIESRRWKQLMLERAGRILLPFLFGIVLIVPIHVYLWQHHYGFDMAYSPGPAHLWFLGNIAAYVLLLSPVFFYLKRNEHGTAGRAIKKLMSNFAGLLLIMAAFVAEVLIADPRPYEMYVMTWHGFFLGLLAFFSGFCLVLSGHAFWVMIARWRLLLLAVSILLFIFRLTAWRLQAPGCLLAIESNCWVFAVFAFGYKYLNRPGRTLAYLSQAAYPVYIVHMIFLYLGSSLIFRTDIDVRLQFILLLVFTFTGCFALYELVIRRVNFIRPLFGLKRMQEGKR